MRLIDADKLKDEVLKQGATYILTLIDNAPTVETGHYLTNCQNCKSDYSRGYDDGYAEGYKAERPTGKWIDHHGLFFECTICKYKTVFGGNYCPNCGADMRGDSHGQ